MALIPYSGGAIDSQDAKPIGFHVRRVMARLDARALHQGFRRKI